MVKAQKPIDPVTISSIPRMKDFINSLPEDLRVCVEHCEPVLLLKARSLNAGAGPPFGKAAFNACCETALNKVLTAIAISQLH